VLTHPELDGSTQRVLDWASIYRAFYGLSMLLRNGLWEAQIDRERRDSIDASIEANMSLNAFGRDAEPVCHYPGGDAGACGQ